MPDYSKGKIYSIRSHQTDAIYIGSTTSLLSRRLSNHRSDYNRFLNGKSKQYSTSYIILEYDDAYIELIETCPCSTGEELHAREGYYIRSMDCVNKCVPGRTKHEKEEMRKQYYEGNRDKSMEDSRRWYWNNRDKSLEDNRKYRLENKDILAERRRKRYLQGNKRVSCEYCGIEIWSGSLPSHQKSWKHLINLERYSRKCASEPDLEGPDDS